MERETQEQFLRQRGLLRHSSYAVMLGQEPSLKSTFPRSGGARAGSPITIKHCWPWAALGGSPDFQKTMLGPGLKITLFPQSPGSVRPFRFMLISGLGEGHRWPTHSHPPHGSLWSILDLGSAWFCLGDPCAAGICIYSLREAVWIDDLEHSGLRSESCTLPGGYSGARVNEHQERGSGSSVEEYQGTPEDLGSDAQSAGVGHLIKLTGNAAAVFLTEGTETTSLTSCWWWGDTGWPV